LKEEEMSGFLFYGGAYVIGMGNLVQKGTWHTHQAMKKKTGYEDEGSRGKTRLLFSAREDAARPELSENF